MSGLGTIERRVAKDPLYWRVWAVVTGCVPLAIAACYFLNQPKLLLAMGVFAVVAAVGLYFLALAVFAGDERLRRVMEKVFGGSGMVVVVLNMLLGTVALLVTLAVRRAQGRALPEDG